LLLPDICMFLPLLRSTTYPPYLSQNKYAAQLSEKRCQNEVGNLIAIELMKSTNFCPQDEVLVTLSIFGNQYFSPITILFLPYSCIRSSHPDICMFLPLLRSTTYPPYLSQNKYAAQLSEKRCNQQVWDKILNIEPCIHVAQISGTWELLMHEYGRKSRINNSSVYLNCYFHYLRTKSWDNLAVEP
jgi:hypothetical protein